MTDFPTPESITFPATPDLTPEEEPERIHQPYSPGLHVTHQGIAEDIEAAIASGNLVAPLSVLLFTDSYAPPQECPQRA
jgi:hypothetical protein